MQVNMKESSKYIPRCN